MATAAPGATAQAQPGVYHGGILITKQLELDGHDAVLDASTSPDGYGIEVAAPGGSGTRIDGWTVMNAQFSGRNNNFRGVGTPVRNN